MVYIIALLAMLFWSLTYIWYKVVFESLQPITVMTFRLALSSILLFAFSKLTHKLEKVSTKNFFWLFMLSLFQPFLYFLFESYGVSMVSATISSVIISTIPVFTPLAAFLFYKEKISASNFWGILISFTGVLFVVFGKELEFSGSWMGIALLFGAVLSTLGYAVIIVRLTTKLNTFTIITWQNILGTILFLPLFLIVDLKTFKLDHLSINIILNLVYLALFGSTIAYVFFTYSIKKLGITKASIFANIIPVFTAIFSYFFLNEYLHWVKWVGIVLVIFGLFIAQKKPKIKAVKTDSLK